MMHFTSSIAIAAWFLLGTGDAQPTRRSSSGELTAANFSTYAPVYVDCPPRKQWTRSVVGLSDEETTWLEGRRTKVLQSLTTYLERLRLDKFDLKTYLQRLHENDLNTPTIGMAISGGGWASSLTGTGALRAFDDRFPAAVEQRTGGLLQSMTYLSGLSGGSWPVMSLSMYNFPSIDTMVKAWHVDVNRIAASNNSALAATPEAMFEQIEPKFKAGFNVSFLEYLGRSFAYEFVPGEQGGMASMVSDIVNLSNFKEHNMPLPMWQAGQATPDDTEFFGLQVPNTNATIFEWTPFEFGAWNGPAEFFPTQYLGTKMSGGVPVGQCVRGFDRASFMLGAAADASNFWYLENDSNYTLGDFSKRDGNKHDRVRRGAPTNILFTALQKIQKSFRDTFNYSLQEMMYLSLPNPFATADSKDNNSNPPANLTLMDESEMMQAIPLWSQIQPSRNLDFIIAWDDDEDTRPYAWNNGTNLVGTADYATNNSIPFPLVPSVATFINRNFTSRPTFFGCNTNLTNTGDTRAPIVLYLPNAPYSAYTNYSWIQTAYSNEQMAVILTNSFNYVTQGNGTLDKEWPECLGCAAIGRSLAKVGMARTEQCQSCMDKYCWDGKEDAASPPTVDIPLVLDPKFSFAQWNKTGPESGSFWAEVSK